MKPNSYNYNSQSGMYREKIVILQRVVRKDDLLQDVEDFTVWRNFWAMVKTSKSNEVIAAGQEQMKVQKRYVVKYSKMFDDFINSNGTSFEVVHKGITYDVKEVINDNDLNETITIYCEARE